MTHGQVALTQVVPRSVDAVQSRRLVTGIASSVTGKAVGLIAFCLACR
jgi:hypothetical protein